MKCCVKTLCSPPSLLQQMTDCVEVKGQSKDTQTQSCSLWVGWIGFKCHRFLCSARLQNILHHLADAEKIIASTDSALSKASSPLPAPLNGSRLLIIRPFPFVVIMRLVLHLLEAVIISVYSLYFSSLSGVTTSILLYVVVVVVFQYYHVNNTHITNQLELKTGTKDRSSKNK